MGFQVMTEGRADQPSPAPTETGSTAARNGTARRNHREIGFQQNGRGAGQPEELLKHLIECATVHLQGSTVRPLQRTPETFEEVLLEVTIDTTKYALIRIRPQTVAHVSLSPRERAICKLVVKGLPNKSIGEILEISPWTVATHLRRIFTKLEVTSRTAMVARILEDKLL